MDLRQIKGNLGLKSSALAPTACKLSSQFLVLDHMSNHYTKIAKAKSAIDSRPPKSLMASQKMRDRMNRSRFLGSSQPRSRSSMSGTVLSDYEDVLKDEPEDEEEKLVHSIMRSTLLEKSRTSNSATYGAELHMDPYHEHMSTNIHETSPYGAVIYDHPPSVHSVRSGHSLTSSPSRVALATSLLVKRTCIGDVLEKRPHLFTEPESPFTPRTLKKNTESRLKNSKCYNPPRNKSSKKENYEIDRDKNSKQDTMQNYSKDTVDVSEKGKILNKKQQSKFQSPQQQNNSPQKVNENPGYDLEEKCGTSKLSSSMLMDMSVRSRDEAYSQETVNGVPPLAITMDKDHMNWLKEQASKAEIRVRSSGRLKSSLHPDQELHSVSRYHSRESDAETDNRMEKQRNLRRMGMYRSSVSRSPSSLWISQRLIEEDEEQKYLAFAKEVTDDVLSRGISSDSVLDTVFENHIVRRKDDLDEDRMRKVISDLRKNLGLKDSTSGGQVSSSLSDSNYSNRYKRENTTYNNRGSNPMNSDPDVNSTFESVNTLKFGQTGDVLSTINSDTSLEKKETEKRLDDDNEMAFSQTLRDYQLSLTDKEDIDDSLKESEHNTGVKEDTLRHSYGQLKPAINERRMSREGKHIAEISSNQQTSSIDKSLGTSPENSHVTNDEDTSVSSSVLSQRPVARPRAKTRQGSHERTQAATAAAAAGEDEEVIHHGQQDDVQNTAAGGLKTHNSPVAGRHDTTDSDVARPGNTEGSASETANQETEHQQAVEEDDEYEDDYEEIIESENDSADDF